MTDKSKVFFMDLHMEGAEDSLHNKISKLFDAAGLSDVLNKGDLTALKIHFGEMGNTAFIPPWNIRPIVDKIKEKGAHPFLTDTTTLYIGKRKNAVLHHDTAMKHGYTHSVVDAPVIIADGLRGKLYNEVEIDGKHFQKVKIAPVIVEADSMIMVSHFKGHVMAGFGGAIKNLAMGCANSEGKKEQHSAHPYGDEEECVGCGICLETCPTDSINIENGKAKVDDTCIGCGECIIHCPHDAMKLNWKTAVPEFTERLTEYAYGAWKVFQKNRNKIGFLTFVMNVTPDCDCVAWSEKPIVPDVGILASKDPVALDKACWDLVNNQKGLHDSALNGNYEPGEDKFKAIYEGMYGEIQFNYGSELGMGSLDYDLIKI